MKRIILMCCAIGLGLAIPLLKPAEGNAYTGGAVRFITGVQSVVAKVEWINVKDYQAGTLIVGFTLSGEDPAVIGNRTGYCVKVLVEGRQWQQECVDGDADKRGNTYWAEITVGSPGYKSLVVNAQVRVRYGTGGPDGGLYTSWSPSYNGRVHF